MRLCGPRLGREPHGGGIGCSCGKPYPGKKQYDTWDDEDKAGYQLYLQEQDMEKRAYRDWYLSQSPETAPRNRPAGTGVSIQVIP